MRRSWVRFVLTLAICGVFAVASHAEPSGERDQVKAEGRAGEKKATAYRLTPAAKEGNVTRVQARLQVGGHLKLAGEGKPRRVPMSVEAKFQYEEMLRGDVRDSTQPLHAVRYYDLAEAVIKFDQGGLKPVLRDEHRTIVAHAHGAKTTLFSPTGSLTQDELDLIDIPGNSLLMHRLLPEGPVRLGEAWKPTQAVVAALVGMDVLSQCEVECVLGSVQDGVARIAMAGTVEGAMEGVAAKIELKARYDFDLKHQQVTRLQLVIKEDRAIGHVGSGVDVVAKLHLAIEPVSSAKYKGALDLPVAAIEPHAEATRLAYESPQRGYRCRYERRWCITSAQQDLVVMRMIDRGELVAQCNISPLAPRAPDRQLTLAQFQKDIQYSLKDHFGQFVEAGQAMGSAGQRVLRVVAEGQVEELPIQWRYYLISHERGPRVALVFTVEAQLAERLGTADRELVEGIELFELPASEPVPTATRPARPEKPPRFRR